jgi:protein-tyrosine-phosphatase
METKPKKKILFVCAENTGRSQMAQAFFNRHAKESKLDWEAHSAGTFPVKNINPVVIEVLKEKGIILQQVHPKQFKPDEANNYAKIVSFGCIVKSFFSEDIQKKIEDWHMEDPKDQPIEKVRIIRDEVEQRVLQLIKTL